MEAPRDDVAPLLARIAKKRDAAAISELYDAYSAVAYRIAFNLTQDRGSAEQCLQDAFFEVWRTARSFNPAREPGREWLLSIVRNRATHPVRGVGDATVSDVSRPLPPPPISETDSWKAVAAHRDWHRRERYAAPQTPGEL